MLQHNAPSNHCSWCVYAENSKLVHHSSSDPRNRSKQHRSLTVPSASWHHQQEQQQDQQQQHRTSSAPVSPATAPAPPTGLPSWAQSAAASRAATALLVVNQHSSNCFAELLDLVLDDPPASTSSSSSSSSSGAVLHSQGVSGPVHIALALLSVPIMATTAAAAAPAAAAAAPTGGLLGSPAAAALHTILGTTKALNQITQVKMVMGAKCKMGISFWPTFKFKPPERDEKAGTAKLVNSSDVPPEMTAAGSSSSRSSSSGELPSVSSQLLHVNFTQDPPDEFSVGAKFLGGIPFPFITIRTTRLEGTIDPFTGAVVLLFGAKFLAGMGSKDPMELLLLLLLLLPGTIDPFTGAVVLLWRQSFCQPKPTELTVIDTLLLLLQGTVDPFTGAVVLLFEAKFLAGMGSKKPTELTVNANLTTEVAKAFKKTMEGKRLDNGNVTLVSAAEVPKTSSWFANIILWLPTAATAVLPMKLEFS